MGHEIVYTSARKGLRPGSTGYCTVAATDGIPSNLLNHLEKLTGYEHLFDPKSGHARANPVAFVHFNVEIGGKRQHILGRIANAPLDYSSRSNLIAHLVALDDRDLEKVGNPVQALQQIPWETEWPADREPKLLSPNRITFKPTPVEEPRPCQAWKNVTLDAGWGGVLAESLTVARYRQAAVIVPKEWLLGDNNPGVLYLNLIDESLKLLPREDRWNIGFSTYYTANLPLGIRCDWQFVIAEMPLAEKLRRDPRTLSIELSTEMPPPPDTELVQVARDGGVHRMKSETRAPVRRPVAAPRQPDDPSPPQVPVRAPVVADPYDADELNPDDASARPPLWRRKKRIGKANASSLNWPIFTGMAVVILLLVGVIGWLVLTPAGAGRPGGPPASAEKPAPVAAVEVRPKPETTPPAASQREAAPRSIAQSPPPTTTRRAPDKTGESAGSSTGTSAPSPGKPAATSAPVNPLPQSPAGNSSLAVTTAGASEPSRPETPHQRPFDGIRQQHCILNLPGLNQGADLHARGAASSGALESLASIEIGENASLELDVIGERTFIGDEVVVERTTDRRSWSLGRKGDGIQKRKTFGTFRLLNGRLQFEWNVKDAKGDTDSKLLSCLLHLTVNEPRDEVVCAMRAPVRIEPFILTTAPLNRDLSVELKEIPPPESAESIIVELRWDGLESLPASARFQSIPVDMLSNISGAQACLQLREVETDEVPSAIVAAEFSRDGTKCLLRLSKFARREVLGIVEADHTVDWSIVKTRDGQFECGTDFMTRFAEDIKANADQLNRYKNIAAEFLRKQNAKLEGVKKVRESAKGEERKKLEEEASDLQESIADQLSWIADLEAAIETNSQRIEWAKKIDQAFAALNENVRVHVRMYRVFPETPDTDVAVLLETEGFYDVSPVMTRSASVSAGTASPSAANERSP